MRHILFVVLSLLALSTTAQVRKTTSRGTFSNQPPPAGFTLGSFENTPGYLDGSQVARRITDSLTANAVQVSSDLKLVNGRLSLATPNGTTAVTDNTPTANSTNPVSSGGVYNAINTRAPAAHTQSASTILDFGPAILAWMQAQPGAGTVWSFDGKWISATAGTALPQLAASTLTATASSSVAVGLSWTTSPNALTYVVEQAIDAQFSNGPLVAYSGSATSATLNGQASGTQFFYRIKVKATGYADSDYAFATATTSGTSVPTLATPTVTAGSATSSTVAFSWNAVSNAQSYSVTFATNSALTANATSFTTTSTSYSPTGLTPSTTYYVGVVARATGYNNSGQGTASLATSATAAAGATQLGATTITISSLTTTSATASWGSVANATGYQFQRATDNSFATNVSSATYTATSVNWGDLTAATTYYVRVKALGNGSSFTDGNYSPVVSFTTSAAATGGGSTTALAGVGTLYQNGATTTTVAVSWTMVPNVSNANGTSYQADISTSSSFASILSSVNSATTAMASFTGLSPNTQYYVRVKAVGAGNYTDGGYSNGLGITTATNNGTYALERAFKVNLSTASNTASGGTGWVTIAPALSAITTGYVSPNLTAVDGSSSGVSFSIVSGFSGGGVNYFGGTANVPNAVWPAQVMQRGWTYPQAGGTIRVSGLTAGKVYQVYALSSNISTAQASYATMSANGVTGGIKYIPGNGTDSSPGDTNGPALLVVNNIGAPNGYIDLVVSRPTGTSNQPFQGFIIQESSVNK